MKFINIPSLNTIILKKGQRSLRSDLKAHLNLKRTNRLPRIKEIKRVIDKTPCIERGSYSALIFGAATGEAEMVVRQFLLRSVIENKINRVLINAIGNHSPVAYPLPEKWIGLLKNEGLPVSAIRSKITFIFFVLMRFGLGVLAIIKIFCQSVIATVSKKKEAYGNYVFFDSLGELNLPKKEPREPGYDIISWYEKWNGRIPVIDRFVHTASQKEPLVAGTIPVITISSFVPPLHGFGKLMQYAWWGCKAILLSVFDLLRNRWWHALLLEEAAKSAMVRMHETKDLAREYLFHNSLWIYRPLWTYDAEKAGSGITFYFYSTNVEPLKYRERYEDPHVGWRTATWPHYLVWDEYQAEFVRTSVEKNVNISVAGPISFHAGAGVLPALPENAIAVFDVQPMREGFYYTIGADFDYYVPENCISFLADIYSSVQKHHASIIYKRKRKIGNKVHYRYRNQVNTLENAPGFISIDADLPAQLVIENCVAVISMPFTATALVGKKLGKPSVFYDPHGQLQKDDKAAHGIEVLSGPAELDNWIDSVMKNN